MGNKTEANEQNDDQHCLLVICFFALLCSINNNQNLHPMEDSNIHFYCFPWLYGSRQGKVPVTPVVLALAYFCFLNFQRHWLWRVTNFPKTALRSRYIGSPSSSASQPQSRCERSLEKLNLLAIHSIVQSSNFIMQ